MIIDGTDIGAGSGFIIKIGASGIPIVGGVLIGIDTGTETGWRVGMITGFNVNCGLSVTMEDISSLSQNLVSKSSAKVSF